MMVITILIKPHQNQCGGSLNLSPIVVGFFCKRDLIISFLGGQYNKATS